MNVESPTKTTIRSPLELHSPSRSNIDPDNNNGGLLSSPSSQCGAVSGGGKSNVSIIVKGTPLSSTAPPRMPTSCDNDDNDATNNNTGRDDENYDNTNENEPSFQLSPIGRMELMNTPAPATSGNNNNYSNNDVETPTTNDNVHNNANVMDSSFPDNREDDHIEIRSPDVDDMQAWLDDAAGNDDEENEEVEDEEENEEQESSEDREETEEERMQREIEESEALARQLMAEEAMASYAMSTNYLRDNADQFSEEDMAALQAAMAEEDPENDNNNDGEEGGDEEGNNDEEDSNEMSYDALLQLGERIGNVKEERWALGAEEQINRLPTVIWEPSMGEGKAENHTEVKCQVCQFPYEEGDVLRRLPCHHCFHKDCVDSWLETKDTCALCRKSIVSSLP